MNRNYTEKGKLDLIYDYDKFPSNQLYRLELPNGQRGYDFISKINFNTKSKPGDLDFTKQELIRRGYQWVFDCGFAIPVDKDGKDLQIGELT
ncbi:hypothetical protein [Streptococcus pluranimalium]|nr:hypothetical protein [Streptococcus suis]